MDAPTSVPSDPESQEVYPGECEQNHALDDLLQVLACLLDDIPLVLLATRGGLRILMQPDMPLTADTIDRYRVVSETIAPSHDPVFIADARLDDRLVDHPLVTGEPPLRFYGGVPLISPDGERIGTLSIIDHVPRTLSPNQSKGLRALARRLIPYLNSPAASRPPNGIGARASGLSPAWSRETATHLLNNIIEHIPLAVFVKNARDQFRVELWNKEAERLFDIPRAEMLGSTAHDYWPKVQADAYLADDLRTVREGIMVDREEPSSPHAAHGSRWLRTRKVPLADEAGRATYLLAISEDLTERKQVEEALRESEARYRELFMANPHPMWVYDLESLAFLAVNDAAVTHYGYSRQEFLAMTLKNIHPSEDVNRLLNNVEGVNKGLNLVGVWRHLKKDGSHCSVEITSHALRFEGRWAELALAHDVTERLQAEISLRESEKRFRQVAENIREVFWLTDIEKNAVVYLSPGYEEVWGRTCASVYADPRSWLEAIHPEDRARVLDAALTKQAIGSYQEQYRIIRPDGSVRWILDKAFPVWNDEGHVYRIAGVAEDITERKLVEQARELADASLRRHVERQSILLTASRIILECATLADMTRRVFEAVREHLDVEVCLIYEHVERDGDLRLVFGSGIPPESEADVTRLVPGKAFCGTVFAKREPLMADAARIANDPQADFLLALGIRAYAGHPLFSSDGRVMGTFCVGRTKQDRFSPDEMDFLQTLGHLMALAWDRLNTEAELTQSEERLQFALETIHVGAWDLDLTDQTVRRTSEHDRIFGYREPLSQWTYDRFLEHVCPEDRALVQETFTRATATQSDWNVECRIRRGDGEIRWVWVAGRHKRDQDSPGRGIAGIVQDITERKRADVALRESEERFRLVAEVTNDVLWDWDLRTDDHWWSPNAKGKFGYNPTKEPSIVAWRSRLHPRDRSRVLHRLDDCLKSKERVYFDEYRFRLTDGSYGVFWDKGQVVHDNRGTPVRMVGTMIDVTSIKQAYASLEQAYTRLQWLSRELQRAEERERRRLSRELHDEFGQLLSALRLSLERVRAQLGKRPGTNGAVLEKHLMAATKAVEQLFASLRELVHGLRPAVLDEFGLMPALKSLADDVREATGLDCRLSVGERTLPDAVGQELEGTLFRIAQELITNVVRHAKATQAVIMLQCTDQRVMLTVRDNGRGGRLAMTKGKYGLRGIHERTELLGGQVEMRSGRRGTVVTVALPFELSERNQGSNGAVSRTAARTRKR